MRSDPDDTATTTPRPRGLARRFRRDRRGAVAIEFTLLAIPFCMLVFAILETCISFASQQVMANATDDIARMIRTGQPDWKAADIDEDKLKTAICDRLSIIASNCKSNIIVDLREYTTFAKAAEERIKVVNGEIDTTGFAVKPGKSMTKNMLRVFYKWPVMTDFMRKSMSNLKDGKTLHFASVTWQNEPFDD